jgi:hypothetical protein
LTTVGLVSSDPQPRLARRCFRRHAGGEVLRRALLEVEAQFFVNLAFYTTPLPKRADS